MAILPGPVSGGGRETDPHWVCHQPPGGGGTHCCAQTDPEHCSAGEGGREGGRERGGGKEGEREGEREERMEGGRERVDE